MTLESFLQSKDPSDSKDYTFRFLLSTGEAIASATVTVVDATDTAIASTDLIVSNVSFGLISGQVYGVTFYVAGGSAGTYLLRCRLTTTSTPARQFDKTNQLICETR